MHCTITILAGGRSRRMGRDKASLVTDGETLLERTVRVASGTGERTIVVGRSRPEKWSRPDVEFVADDYPGLGPLGGLVTALHYAKGPVLLLPCDMPDLTTDAVQWLAAIVEDSASGHGLVVRNGDRIEPLFSVYFRSALSLAEERIDRKMLAMREFIEAGEFGFASVPEAHSHALRNVNRPEEWPGR